MITESSEDQPMPLRYHAAIGLFFVGIIGGLLVVFWRASQHGELADKRGWSVLQGMDDPPTQSTGLILRRREEFDVLGFPGVGQTKGRIYGAQPHWSWVLLNEHDVDDEVKQMPEFGSYDLHCTDLSRVERAVRNPDRYALKYLRSICT